LKTHITSIKYPVPALLFSCLAIAMLFTYNVNGVFGQTSPKKSTGDIKQINQLLARISDVEDTDTKAAFVLINQVKALCAKANIDTLKAKVYDEEGFCNFYAGNYKRAVVVFDSAAILWKKTNRLQYFKALNDKATALMYNSEYHKSLLVFFECMRMDKYISNKKVVGKVLNNIGLVYESIEDPDNAIYYEKKSLVYKLPSKDALSLASTYGNIGDAFLNKGVLDSAIIYEQHSYRLYLSKQDKAGLAISLGDIGNMYYKKQQLDSSLYYLLKAVAISQKLSNVENTGNIEDNLAEIYLKKHDLPQAKKYVLMAEAYVPQITDNEFLQEHYDLMYRYFKQTGNTVKAFSYLEKLNAVQDSIFNQKINIQNQKIAFEYEYKQKKLKDSLVFQSQINVSDEKAAATRSRYYVSLLLLLAAILLAVIWYSRSKLLQKKNIVAQQNFMMQEQKIRELENEKQLLASQGVLKGQEEERSRLARDLHDGLGGLLSGVKHSIINMKERIVISSRNVEVFEKSLNMIDTAMKELRRVAQNMMPEALAKFGLEEALKDYCASSSTESFKVIFQSFGNPIQIDNAAEIIIYRIIQELINNASKHAHATQVMVQLVKGDGWITLSVEDNGKGFDVDELKNSTGSGWGNIKSRVDYLAGEIDLKSQKGTGTSVNIEIKIPKT
jgi:two-component system NarL family sensor kinase